MISGISSGADAIHRTIGGENLIGANSRAANSKIDFFCHVGRPDLVSREVHLGRIGNFGYFPARWALRDRSRMRIADFTSLQEGS